VAQEKITREKIISAVLNIAFSQSAAGTSLSDIASSIGIKKASLYNHFENREAIFSSVCAFCAQFMDSNAYIPQDYETSIKKYAPAVVLKGIVRRYIKIYEKDLPLRIYAFIASEKYFLKDAAGVYRQEREKIASQVKILFNALKTAKKLDPKADAEKDAFWFENAAFSYTEDHLLAVKNAVTAGTRAPGLLQLAENDSNIEWFCRRIGAVE
jgi:AcrR family transcriptional regulator